MRPSICYVASYDPGYSRNTDIIRAMRSAGIRVEVVRGPEGSLFKSGTSRWSLISLALKFLLSAVGRWTDVTLRLLRCQAVIIGYFGQLDLVLIAPVARALGRPVIFSPLVTLTDTIVEDRRFVAPGSLPAGLIHWLDRRALRSADVILVDTAENAFYAAEMSGVPRSRFVVLPVGVDERIFYPRSESDEHGGDVLDVLFYGTFIPLHGIETIIRAAADLQRRDTRIRFELIGTGQDYEESRRLAELLGVTNIHWRDWLPYSELGDRLREADVALGIFDDGPKASRVIANKVHQALASGVPVVTRASPAVNRLLKDGESALLVPAADHRALADAISRLAGDDRLRARIGEGGRRAWSSNASAGRLAEIAVSTLTRAGVRP